MTSSSMQAQFCQNLTNNDQEDNDVTGDVIQAAILILVIMTSCMGNLTVLYIIGHNSQMRTVTNALIASLSVSDLIAACFTQPITVFALYNSAPFTSHFCILYTFLSQLQASASTFTITVIAIDRLLSIARPPGKRRLTSYSCSIVIGSLWLAAIVFACPWYILYESHKQQSFPNSDRHQCIYQYNFNTKTCHQMELLTWLTMIGSHFLPIGIMLYCSWSLWRTVREGETKIRPATVEPRIMIFHSEIRTAITVIIIIALFTLCWIPILTVTVIRTLMSDHVTRSELRVGRTFVSVNVMINPLLYACRNPHIAEFLKIRKSKQKVRSFTNLAVERRTTPSMGQIEGGGVVSIDGDTGVSTDEIQAKFQWTIAAAVKKSPIATRLLMCTTRTDSDLHTFTVIEHSNGHSSTA